LAARYQPIPEIVSLHRPLIFFEGVTVGFIAARGHLVQVAILRLDRFVDGLAGAVVALGGRPIAVFAFTVRDSRSVGIDRMSDPETLSSLDLEPLRLPEAAGTAVNPTGEGGSTP
jgi:hypothetical protein